MEVERVSDEMSEFLGSEVLRDRPFVWLNSQVWTAGVRAQPGIRQRPEVRKSQSFSLSLCWKPRGRCNGDERKVSPPTFRGHAAG